MKRSEAGGVKDVKITACAKALPERIVTNDHLAQIMDTSDEWIRTRTGIRQRHLSTGENTSDLASKVATKLLKQAGLEASELDLLVVATMSPDSQTPSVSNLVQAQIGAVNAVCFDLSAACSGFVYALTAARSLMLTLQKKTALVIGAEVLSKLLDWQDRSTAVLFGDGAGGVLLEASQDAHFLAQTLTSFGESAQAIVAGANPAGKFPQTVLQHSPFTMDGRKVYHFATHQVPQLIAATAEEAGLELAQIDWFLLHQANRRIIEQVAKRLDLPLAKFPMNIQTVGNTAAASEGILLADCLAEGLIKPGQTVMMCGYGGGLSVGCCLVKF